jgi:hypothetical protein
MLSWMLTSLARGELDVELARRATPDESSEGTSTGPAPVSRPCISSDCDGGPCHCSLSSDSDGAACQ